MRKHGHGAPWRHKYKVLEVKPYAVRLEVPKDGSVPAVNEWQLIRRLSPASAHEHSHDSDAPVLTESGVLVPHSTPSVPPRTAADALDGPLDADDDVYVVDRVSHAEKVMGMYKIWIKWKGYSELTWRWRHELQREETNATVLREVEAAVEAERVRLSRVAETEVDSAPAPTFASEGPPVPTTLAPSDPTLPISSRLRRRPDALLTISEFDEDVPLRAYAFYIEWVHY